MGASVTPSPSPSPSPTPSDVAPRPRSPLRAVAVPIEHGGWGLTLEPILMGLLISPSVAGLCIGLAAMSAFVARTPLKVLLVDARRGRTLERTRLAAWVLVGEGVVLGGLVAVTLLRSNDGFWVPIVAAAPLLGLELWYDMRSRSRRLVPELAGAMGIGGVAAMIVLAGGGGGRLAVAVWLILVARGVTAIVMVRDQVGRLHGRDPRPIPTVVADVVALMVAAAAVVVGRPALAGAVAVVGAIVAQRLLALRPPPRAVVLGLRQTAIGLTVVIVTAIGVFAA